MPCITASPLPMTPDCLGALNHSSSKMKDIGIPCRFPNWKRG